MLALLFDTYQALRHRALFWITVWISTLLLILLASIGFHEKGWSLLFGLIEFKSEYLVKDTVWSKSLLLMAVRGLVDWWVATFALLLALFPTGTILIDAMKPGTIDFLLSKPISRLQLFLGKYLGAVLMVLVQSFYVVGGCVLIVWLRLGEFYPSLLWAALLATLIFSCIFCFQYWMTVLMNSSMGALLLTVLFWGMLWLLQYVDNTTTIAKESGALTALAGKDADAKFEELHKIVRGALWVLPKTRECGMLVDKLVRVQAPYGLMEIGARSGYPSDKEFEASQYFLNSVNLNKAKDNSVRSAWIVVGSSLAFQFGLLVLGYRGFHKRDF